MVAAPTMQDAFAACKRVGATICEHYFGVRLLVKKPAVLDEGKPVLKEVALFPD